MKALILALLLTGCAVQPYCPPIANGDVVDRPVGYVPLPLGLIIPQSYEKSVAICKNAINTDLTAMACRLTMGGKYYVIYPEGCHDILLHELKHVTNGPGHKNEL